MKTYSISSSKSFKRLYKRLREVKLFSMCHFHHQGGGGVGISIDGREGFFLPIFHDDLGDEEHKRSIDSVLVYNYLVNGFEKNKIRPIFFDAFKDISFWKNIGVHQIESFHDVSLMAHLSNKSYDFKALSKTLVDDNTRKILKLAKEELHNSDFHYTAVARHTTVRACVILQMFNKLKQRGKDAYNTDLETTRLLTNINFSGIRINPAVNLPDITSHGTAQGFVHPSFNLHTSTGRIYCANPNLLNIERSKRNILVPIKDCVLVSLDYSQMEMRVLAVLSRDKALLAEKDVHEATAKLMRVDREVGKLINFAIVYGTSPAGLEKTVEKKHGIKIDGKSAIKKFLKKFKGVKRFISQIKGELESSGHVTSHFDRALYCEKGNLRQAFNYVIQGTAADVFKQSLINVDKFLQGRHTRIALPIHDEVLLYWHKEELDLLDEVAELMEQDFDLKVRISYSDKSFGDLKEL